MTRRSNCQSRSRLSLAGRFAAPPTVPTTPPKGPDGDKPSEAQVETWRQKISSICFEASISFATTWRSLSLRSEWS